MKKCHLWTRCNWSWPPPPPCGRNLVLFNHCPNPALTLPLSFPNAFYLVHNCIGHKEKGKLGTEMGTNKYDFFNCPWTVPVSVPLHSFVGLSHYAIFWSERFLLVEAILLGTFILFTFTIFQAIYQETKFAHLNHLNGYSAHLKAGIFFPFRNRMENRLIWIALWKIPVSIKARRKSLALRLEKAAQCEQTWILAKLVTEIGTEIRTKLNTNFFTCHFT